MAVDRRPSLLHSINEGGIDPPYSLDTGMSNEEPDGDEPDGDVHEVDLDIDTLLREINDLKGEVRFLQGQNASLSEKVRLLEAKINSLVHKIDQNEEELTTLKQQIHDLKQELEESKRGEDILYISQVVFLFEQAICSYVMPEVFLNDKHATIKQLLNYLNGGDELPVQQEESNEERLLRAAKKRWDEVCDLLQLPGEWKNKAGDWRTTDRNLPGVIKAITLLKRQRIAVAHPQCISLKLAEVKIDSDSTKSSFPPWQIKVVKHLITFLRSPVLQANITTELHQMFKKLKLKLD